VKRYGQYGRKVGWIVKWYGKYRGKVNWIVERYVLLALEYGGVRKFTSLKIGKML
jgi:hypothetical protein